MKRTYQISRASFLTMASISITMLSLTVALLLHTQVQLNNMRSQITELEVLVDESTPRLYPETSNIDSSVPMPEPSLSKLSKLYQGVTSIELQKFQVGKSYEYVLEYIHLKATHIVEEHCYFIVHNGESTPLPQYTTVTTYSPSSEKGTHRVSIPQSLIDYVAEPAFQETYPNSELRIETKVYYASPIIQGD